MCVSIQSEKLLLFDTVQSELEEKIRRLEEDRHSIDITSGSDLCYAKEILKKKKNSNQIPLCVQFFLPELWNDELSGRRKRRDALSPDKKRRRPSVVSDILLQSYYHVAVRTSVTSS